MEPEIIIGLPKGSMNNPSRRGYSAQLLHGAGFVTRGYDPGVEENHVVFLNYSPIRGSTVISQRSHEQLYEGNIDALVAGADWAREWALEGRENHLIRPLGFGDVNIVTATPKETGLQGVEKDRFYHHMLKRAQSNNIVQCFTEYPAIAEYELMSSKPYRDIFGDMVPERLSTKGEPINRGRPVNKKVRIRHIHGHAESELGCDADWIVECTQTGDSLRRGGAVVGYRIMASEAGLYVSDKTMKDPEKLDMVYWFGSMLGDGKRKERPYGMEEQFMVDANVNEQVIRPLASMITEKDFCDVAPSLSDLIGRSGYKAIKVDIPVAKWPYFARELWNFNARHIGIDGDKSAVDDIRIGCVIKSLGSNGSEPRPDTSDSASPAIQE